MRSLDLWRALATADRSRLSPFSSPSVGYNLALKIDVFEIVTLRHQLRGGHNPTNRHPLRHRRQMATPVARALQYSQSYTSANLNLSRCTYIIVVHRCSGGLYTIPPSRPCLDSPLVYSSIVSASISLRGYLGSAWNLRLALMLLTSSLYPSVSIIPHRCTRPLPTNTEHAHSTTWPG